MAGIGVKCLAPATRTRCIVIELERAGDGDDFEPLTEVDTIENPWPELTQRLARWADDFPAAAGGRVDMAGLSRRAADNWRPLFAIAEALAGDWPARARKAARVLSDAKRVVDEDVKVQLLSDLRDIFGERERMFSDDIVAALVALEDHPWAEWKQGKPLSKTALARLLKDFKVPSPKSIEMDGRNLKGYERTWLDRLFKLYLAPKGDDETSDRQNPHGDWDSGESKPSAPSTDLTVGNLRNPALEAGSDGLTDETPLSGGCAVHETPMEGCRYCRRTG